MTKKYVIYDNFNKCIVFETDNIHKLNKFLIMYFENCTIKMKK